MPITELPESTVKLLGPPQIISTPVSLVKELLDNAIDAKATSIEVLLSPNPTDRVEVRDNGVGIHPGDYKSLGKHGHTSKLVAFEDLRTLAGSTLGFRGKALASANALGKLTITTKTSSDPVAAVLQINSQDGGVEDSDHGSAPVGTTVSVTELYHQIPVRKKMADKSASQSLEEIQRLLQSYAMARPQLKLTMKVFKSSKRNWIYSPKPGDGVEEAMIQIFGIDAKYRCIVRVESFGSTGTENGDPQLAGGSPEPGFVFEAYLVAPTVPGLDRVPRQCFFSVDSRPITGSRGIAKRFKSTYRKYVARMLGISSEARLPENIFIRLNIKCPKGSYDVNIEPLKDSVLFEDEETVVAYFEEFCKNIYGPHNNERKEIWSPTGPDEADPSLGDLSHFQHSGPPIAAPTAPQVGQNQHGKPAGTVDTVSNEGEKSKVITGFAAPKAPGVVPRTELAQMQLPVPTPGLASMANTATFQSHNNAGRIGGLHIPGHGVPKPQHSAITSDMSVDPSGSARGNSGRKKPARPSQTGAFSVGTRQNIAASPKQPLDAWSGSLINVHRDLGRIHTTPIQLSSQDYGNRSSSTPEPPILHHPGAPPGDLDLPPGSRQHFRPYNDNLTSIIPAGPYQSPFSSPIKPNPTQAKRSHGSRTQLPWTPPSSTRKNQDEWESRYSARPKRAVDGLKQTTLSFHNGKHGVFNGNTKGQEVPNTSRRNSTRNRIPQLSQAFETTFSTARQQLMAENNTALVLKNALVGSVAKSNEGHTRKPLKDKEPFAYIRSSNAQCDGGAEPYARPIETSLLSDDSRAYLLRRQKSAEASKTRGRPTKLRRLISSYMPLETIPRDAQIHNIILEARMDFKQFEESFKSIQKYDMYVIDGGNEEALDLDHNEACRVQERLDALLSWWLEQKTGEKAKVESHLCQLLKGSGTEVEV
jgi:DNA mismatch repair protein MutL